MRRIKYFSIIPSLSVHAPMSLFYQEEKNELYLSPNVKLCGFGGMAHIETEALAQRFLEACTPRLQKRYGNNTSLEVVNCEASEHKKLLDRIKRDSEIIQKRLETSNFAPNKAP